MLAQGKLVQNREQGKAPAPRITPPFNDYCHVYLDWLRTAEAKSKLTIARESSALNHCIKHFGCTRLSAITAANIQGYVLERKREGMHSRSVNLHIIALRNLFNFAKLQGVLKHELPTRDLKQLPYKAPKRSLLPSETIDALCAEAVRLAADPDVDLILRIQQEYSENAERPGETDWECAWTDHPEWRKQLHAHRTAGALLPGDLSGPHSRPAAGL